MIIKWNNIPLIISLLLVTGLLVICYSIIASPVVSKRKVAEYVMPRVEVINLEQDSFAVSVQAFGLVKPAYQALELSAKVSGEIVLLHPNFKPGGVITAGETIAQIDVQDYQLAVKEAAARLVSATTAVSLEQGQQQIAKANFALASGNKALDSARSALALRQPQLDNVMALHRIAQLSLDKAKLALARTALWLPYDAVVLKTAAAHNQMISTSMPIATFAHANRVWLELKVAQKHLASLTVKTDEQPGSVVSFSSNDHQYQGQVISIMANVALSTRMGGVIVEVNNRNHFNTTTQNLDFGIGDTAQPPLIIGSHIEATLQAGMIDKVVKIPRKAMTDINQIYVVDGSGKLQLRDIEIVWSLHNELLVKPQSQPNDRLIVSRVAGIATGTLVNVAAVDSLLAAIPPVKK